MRFRIDELQTVIDQRSQEKEKLIQEKKQLATERSMLMASLQESVQKIEQVEERLE